MLNGNISNREAPVIAFNLDNLLFEKEEESFFRIFTKKKVNQAFIDIVSNLWYSYDYSIYLVTSQSVEDAEKTLNDIDIQATKIVHYTGIANLKRLVSYRFHLYVDSDLELISILNSSNAISIDDLHKYIKTTRRG